MQLQNMSCPTCGAPLTVPSDVDRLLCIYCNSQFSVQSGEGYVALKAIEKLGQVIQDSSVQTQQKIGEGTQVTQMELQRLQLTQELTTTQLQLSNLQAEIRTLERGGRNRKANKQLRELRIQEKYLVAQIATLQAVLMPQSKSPDQSLGRKWDRFFTQGFQWGCLGILLFFTLCSGFGMFVSGSTKQRVSGKTLISTPTPKATATSAHTVSSIEVANTQSKILIPTVTLIPTATDAPIVQSTVVVPKIQEEPTQVQARPISFPVNTPTKIPEQINPSKEYIHSTIEYDELFRHSEKYVGTRLEYVGKIVQVQEESCSDCTSPYYYMRIQVTKGNYGLWDDVIYFEIESAERFLEDDIVVFRGVYKGLHTYTAVLGHAVTVPAVIGESIELGSYLSKSSSSGPSANNTANLRSGPGTNYSIVGSVQPGQTLRISAQNQDGTWLKLEDGKWIAAFLVDNTPTNLPIEANVNASTTLVVQQPTQQAASVIDWRSASAQTCGDFEWKVTDVRRTKETWHYNEKTVARGQYLIIYIEIKNVGPGTSDLESSSAPRLDGRRYDFNPSWDAAWMMTGGHNVTWNDYNPGEVITVVAGFDVQPGDGYTFGMENCQQYVSIGTWDQVVDGVIRAS